MTAKTSLPYRLGFSLRFTVAAALILFTAIMSLWSGIVLSSLLKEQEKSQTYGELRRDLDALQESIEYFFAHDAPRQVPRVLVGLAASPNILGAFALNEDNVVFAAHRQVSVGDSLAETIESIPLITDDIDIPAAIKRAKDQRIGEIIASIDDAVLIGVYPLILGIEPGQLRPTRVGALIVVHDQTRSWRAAEHLIGRGVLRFGALLTLLSVGLAWVGHHLITRRVEALVTVARRIGTGDRMARVELTGYDELAQIGQALNEMADEVARRQQEADHEREKYQTLFELATIGIFVATTDGRLTNVNQHVCDLLGYSQDELLSLRLRDIVVPDSWKELEHELTRLSSINRIDGEWRFQGRDSGTFTGELSARLLPDGRIQGTIQNITERRQAEETLRASEERYRLLVETSPYGIHQIDLDGKITTMNRAGLEMMGVSSIDDITGSPYLDKVSENDRERIEILMHDAMAGRASEFQFEAASGQIFVSSFVPIRDRHEDVTGTMGIAHDVTKQEAAEEERSRLLEILKRSLNEIYVFDAQSLRFEYLNASALNNLGYSEEDMLQMTPFDIKPEFSETAFRDLIAPLLAGERDLVQFETLHQRADGSRYPVEVHLQLTPFGEHGVFLAVILDITERQRTDEELRLSTARFTSAFEFAAVGMSVNAPDGRFIEVNRALCELTGYSESKLLASSYEDITHPDDLDWNREYVRQMLTGKIQTYQIEKRYIHQNGSTVWVLLSISLVRDDQNEPLYFITQMQDVTRSQESAQRLQLACESAMIGMWDYNVSDNKLIWDEQMHLLYGTTPASCEGTVHDWERAVHPDDFAFASGKVADAIAGQSEFHTEFRIVRPDGDIRYLEAHAVTLPGPDGTTQNMIGVNWDVTATREAEARLVEQASLLDLATDAITVCDLERNVTYWSHGAADIFGANAESAKGQSMATLMGIEPEELEPAVEATIEFGQWTGEFSATRSDGADIIIFTRLTQLRDADAQPVRILAISTDITDKKHLEAQFLHAQRLDSLGVLAGGIAHDLNNILLPILVATELMEKEQFSARARKLTTVIRTNTERGKEIVQKVLTYSGDRPSKRISLSPNEALDDVLLLLRETFPSTIRIDTEIGPDLPAIIFDPSQFHQIMLNLCINARDAMPEGGTLFVGASTVYLDASYCKTEKRADPGQYLILEVRDTGVGISAAVRDKIFDPFFTTKDVGQGTGLGLSTCIGIARNRGGFINVYSEPDAGSTFKVFLPITLDAGLVIPPVPQTASSTSSGELIMIVDDEPFVLEIIDDLLTDLGYAVVSAGDGATALEIYESRMAEIAVVVVDITMPGMDGITLSHALRKLNAKVKIIAATGLATDDIRAKAEGAGIVQLLAKPYGSAELLPAVRNAIDAPGK